MNVEIERPVVACLGDSETSPPDLPFPGRLLVIETAAGPVRVWRAQDPYSLLEDPQIQADFDRDQRMPYWAELWASSIYLCTRLLRHPELAAGKRVLELGAGLGLPGVAAAKACAQKIVISDIAPQAIAASRVTARENGFENDSRVCFEILDIYEPPTELGLFDLVMAGDVLFERRLRRPLLLCTKAMLKPDGEGLLLDPGREWVSGFEDEAREVGFHVEVESIPFEDLDERPVTVKVYHLHHRPR